MEKYWHENCESWLIYMSHSNTSWPTLQHLNSAVMGYLKCSWGNQLIGLNNQTVLQCMNHTILLLVKHHFHITTLHKYTCSFFVFYFNSSYIYLHVHLCMQGCYVEVVFNYVAMVPSQSCSCAFLGLSYSYILFHFSKCFCLLFFI